MQSKDYKDQQRTLFQLASHIATLDLQKMRDAIEDFEIFMPLNDPAIARHVTRNMEITRGILDAALLLAAALPDTDAVVAGSLDTDAYRHDLGLRTLNGHPLSS